MVDQRDDLGVVRLIAGPTLEADDLGHALPEGLIELGGVVDAVAGFEVRCQDAAGCSGLVDFAPFN